MVNITLKKNMSNFEDNSTIENSTRLMMIYLYSAIIGCEKGKRVDQLFGWEYKHVKGIHAYYKRI